MSDVNDPEIGDDDTQNIVSAGQAAQGQAQIFIDPVGTTATAQTRNLAGYVLNPNDPDCPQPQTRAGAGT